MTCATARHSRSPVALPLPTLRNPAPADTQAGAGKLSRWIRRSLGWATWDDLTTAERQLVAHMLPVNTQRRLG